MVATRLSTPPHIAAIDMTQFTDPAAQVLEADAAHGVTFRIMVPSDVPAVTKAMAAAFHAGEPTTGGGACTLADWMAFTAMYVPRMAEQGLTVVAVDGATGCVLGAFLNEDYATRDPPAIKSFLEGAEGDWMPTFAAIDVLETHFNVAHGVPAVGLRPAGQWFHMWMLGVVPQGRGKGIARKLALHSLAVAKAKGFATAFAECTGAVSTHILVKHCGAAVEKFVDYATFDGCDTAAAVLRGLPAQGHKGMSLTVNQLV